MCRKFIYLMCFVLVFSLAGSASAVTFYDFQWTNTNGNGQWNQLYPTYNWIRAVRPDPNIAAPNDRVWTVSGPPETQYSHDIWLTPVGPDANYWNVLDTNVVIPVGYNADCNDHASTWQTLFGPGLGMKLDIYGRLGISWAISPMQDVNGLVISDPCDPNFNPDNDPNRSVVNMYDGSEIYGPWETGGTLGGNRCESICIGLWWVGTGPYVTWNMYGDSVVYSNSLHLGGHLNMYGGTMDILDYVMVGERAPWSVPDELIRINIEEGTLILPDFFTDAVNDWIERGILLAYGGTPGLPGGPQIIIDTEVNPDRTTITAIPTSPPEAWQPSPRNGVTDVPLELTLSWWPGLYADSVNGHRVYLDPDEQKVIDRSGCEINDVNTTDPCYPIPSPLDLDQTYYWAVDEVNDACDPNGWPGSVWSFTTVPYLVVENFDSYAANEDLWDVWKDRDFGGINAYLWLRNGATFPEWVRDGNSMEYIYHDEESPEYYSEVYADVCDLPSQIGSDWTARGVKALVLYFYGQSDNDANEQMYVRLSDGSNEGVVTYGDYYDEDPNDLRVEEWHEWDIDLEDFNSAGVDLTDVTRITIGFGDGSNPSPASGQGTVYFEDIRLYLPWCRPELVATDFTGDCKVDTNDLQMMTEVWLGQMPTLPTPVIDINTAYLPASGTLSTWDNKGSAGGSFVDFNSAISGYKPTIQTIEGVKAVVFDGNDIMMSDFNCPASITGDKPFTVIYKVLNPEIDVEEWVIQWAKRGGPDGTYAAAGYGTSPQFGVAALWGPGPDVGFDRGVPAANTWHTIAFTHPQGDPNTVVTVMVDGVVNATDGPMALNIWPDCPISVGAAYDGNSNDPNAVLTPVFSLSGAVESVKIYDVYIAPGDLAILMGTGADTPTPVDLKNDDVINFKDYVFLADMWLEEQLWPE